MPLVKKKDNKTSVEHVGKWEPLCAAGRNISGTVSMENDTVSLQKLNVELAYGP